MGVQQGVPGLRKGCAGKGAPTVHEVRVRVREPPGVLCCATQTPSPPCQALSHCLSAMGKLWGAGMVGVRHGDNKCQLQTFWDLNTVFFG
uniref:Uncharacterized protein n=1 Tax=Zosterops lateralis melanops TaxID=1220523 RepID=A0A8D2NQ51_ZOSLA